jgi:NAD(P)-dependent dehydrogenase (short-subunit alcohol dehydrogenase family)
MGQLDGQVAIVIGGHSGIGLAIGERFAHEGAHVVVAARRTDLVRHVAESIGGTAVTCDITSDAEVQDLMGSALQVSGSVDVVVNCAGFEQSTPLEGLTPDRLAAMHAVQFSGALYAMRHGCNAMAATGGGAYLNLSSLTAHNPAIGLTAYGSAKAGIEYAGRIAAVEYGPRHVRVNAVAASLIETPMTARLFGFAPAIATLLEVTPLRRMGTVDDIANAALFLCGPMGSYVTGQTLCVDGGASCQMLPSPQMYADVAARLAAQG